MSTAYIIITVVGIFLFINDLRSGRLKERFRNLWYNIETFGWFHAFRRGIILLLAITTFVAIQLLYYFVFHK